MKKTGTENDLLPTTALKGMNVGIDILKFDVG